MNELLLFSGNLGRQYFPESGPGNKNLRAGTEEIGYFGTVSSTELFHGQEVHNTIGLTAGLANVDLNNTWMKFVYKGKFLFVCKDYTRYNLSWNDLYKAGAIYGVRGNGPYPVAGSPTSQWNVMVKAEPGVALPWKLAVRTLKGASVDPYVGVDYTAFGFAEGNEHNDLIFRLLTPGANSRPNTGIFEKWPGTDLGASGNTSQGYLQETSDANAAVTMLRGPTGSTIGRAKATINLTSDAWRPVLEVLPNTYVFDPYHLDNQVVGVSIPSIKETAPTADAIQNLRNIRQAEWLWKQPVVTEKLTADTIFGPRNPTASTLVSLNAVALTAAGVDLVASPNNPVWSVANLNPVALSGTYIA